MEASEYANLAQLEEVHWYYAGKRRIVRHWLGRVAQLTPEKVLLDCGAGTGRFAHEMQADCQVFVLDDHEEALQLLRAKFRPEQVLALSGDRVPLQTGSLDVVTALDVLEHVPDDRAVVGEFARLLKAGGTVLVTVPASRALWSDWDVALHHYRRYSLRELRALFNGPDWEIRHAAYTNVVVFPGVWLVRRLGGWIRRGARAPARRAEDQIPPGWLNRLLETLFIAPARTRLPFPFGVSLILVATRK